MLPLTLLIVGAVLSLPLTAVGLPGTWAFLAGDGLWARRSTDGQR